MHRPIRDWPGRGRKRLKIIQNGTRRRGGGRGGGGSGGGGGAKKATADSESNKLLGLFVTGDQRPVNHRENV